MVTMAMAMATKRVMATATRWRATMRAMATVARAMKTATKRAMVLVAREMAMATERAKATDGEGNSNSSKSGGDSNEEGNGKGTKSNGYSNKEGDGDGGKIDGNSNKEGNGKGGQWQGREEVLAMATLAAGSKKGNGKSSYRQWLWQRGWRAFDGGNDGAGAKDTASCIMTGEWGMMVVMGHGLCVCVSWCVWRDHKK